MNIDKNFLITPGFEICPRFLAVQLDLSTLHNSLSHFFLILSKTGNEITTFEKVFLELGIFLLQYFIPILWTVNLSSQVIGQAAGTTTGKIDSDYNIHLMEAGFLNY